MQSTTPQPVFLNVEYFFFLAARAVGDFFSYIFSIQFLETARVVATIIVILLIALVLYLLVRLHELKEEQALKKKSAATISTLAVSTGTSGSVATSRNETWEAIRAKLLSDNQSDWRLAIIEADIYMDKMLDNKGFYGETTADKLKRINSGDFASLNVAWEAHKVRNRIAHDGAAFTLTQPEARRILSYYEIVFRDLEVIQ